MWCRMVNSYRPSFSCRGHFSAHGVFLSASEGERVCRERVLAMWRVNARVYFFPKLGYLVLWQQPLPLDSRSVRGLLVLRNGEGYSTIPGHVVGHGEFGLAHGGRLQCMMLDEVHLVDPTSWLDTHRFTVKRALAPPLATVKLDPPAALEDTRDILADIPPMEDAARRFTQPGGQTNAPTSAVERIGAMATWISKLLASKGNAAVKPARPTQAPALSMRRIRFAEWLRQSRLGRLIGRQQARYISRLMRMLDDGDVDAALRHSIPLGGDEGNWRGYSWGMPMPRSGNNILPSAASGFHTLLIDGESLHDMLQQRYRNLATRLERRRQIDRAAFVLAELLSTPAEAVSLLERHGKLRKAAEIAELKELPAGLVIRQWFIAGDTEHALLVAHRSGQFADAIARVESSHPERAGELRKAWAEQLALAGHYAAAVEVLWPLQAERQTALQWIDICLEAGGAPAARMLVKRLELEAGELSASGEQVLQWVAYERDEAASAGRVALLQAMSEGRTGDQVYAALTPWLGSILRSMLFDLGQGVVPVIARNKLEQVARRGGQRALLADWPLQSKLPPRRPVSELVVTAADTGTRAVFDFVLLQSGRSLHAMGESGVELRKHNRVVHRFEAPAVRFVVSDNGTRAIALAKRDQCWRATLLHLDKPRAFDFGDIELTLYCDTFDGSEWFVTRDRQLMALSTLGGTFNVSWHTDDIGRSGIQGIVRDSKSLQLLVADEDLQCWRYEVPGMLLRSRDSVEPPELCNRLMLLDGGDLLAGVVADELTGPKALADAIGTDAPAGNSWLLRRESGSRHWHSLKLPSADLFTAVASRHYLAIASVADNALLISVLDKKSRHQKFTLTLQGASDVKLRWYEQNLHLADAVGRCMTIDPQDERLLLNLRV